MCGNHLLYGLWWICKVVWLMVAPLCVLGTNFLVVALAYFVMPYKVLLFPSLRWYIYGDRLKSYFLCPMWWHQEFITPKLLYYVALYGPYKIQSLLFYVSLNWSAHCKIQDGYL